MKFVCPELIIRDRAEDNGGNPTPWLQEQKHVTTPNHWGPVPLVEGALLLSLRNLPPTSGYRNRYLQLSFWRFHPPVVVWPPLIPNQAQSLEEVRPQKTFPWPLRLVATPEVFSSHGWVQTNTLIASRVDGKTLPWKDQFFRLPASPPTAVFFNSFTESLDSIDKSLSVHIDPPRPKIGNRFAEVILSECSRSFPLSQDHKIRFDRLSFSLRGMSDEE